MSMATDPRALPQRLYWIDALRGVAALAVVVFHYHHFYLRDHLDRPNLPPVTDFPYASAIGFFYTEWSASAVQLFWLISGIVFLHVYQNRRTGLGEFAVARFARLYPLHFATLLIVAALQVISLNLAGHWQVYGSNDGRHFLLQLFLASNSTTLSRGLSFNGPIWSVSLEIPVYFLFLAALPFLKRAPLVVSSVLALASVAVLTLGPGDIPPVRAGVFLCAAFFFLGSALYTLAVRTRGNVILTALLFAAAAALFVAGFASDRAQLMIAGTAAILALTALRIEGRFHPTHGHSWLGDLSYAIYLVHVPLQIAFLVVLDLAFAGDRSIADSLFLLPVYIAATLMTAHIVHNGFEVPIGRKIRTALTLQGPRPNHKEV